MALTKYQKFTHLEHILARPDTYIGSLNTDISNQWLVEHTEEGSRFKEKQTTHIGGLLKIYDEILVNAIDQSAIDKKVDKIMSTVNIEDGFINVTNNGTGGPLEIQETSNGL